jgi:Phage integrase, N-terminal SAM-like domain
VEFGTRVFNLNRDHLQDTWAYKHHFGPHQPHASELFQAKVLAFATSTWVSHANAFQGFVKFCDIRGINPLEVTPQSVNIFLLSLAQQGKSVASIDNMMNSVSFCFRFFLLEDVMASNLVSPVCTFIGKVCPKVTNLKAPFVRFLLKR